MHALAAEAAALLGRAPVRVVPLHGGDLSDVLRLTFSDGSTAIVKSGPAPEIEASMLRAIRNSGASAPKVLACNKKALVMQDLPETGGLSDQAWGDLGSQLRCLHATTGRRYGWEVDYAFGQVSIRNRWHDDWPAFWAENRLLADLAELPRRLHTPLEQIATALPGLLPASPPASLLHGDLWTGNVMADGPRLSALIDPACYFGHGEVDLAMLELFGQPAPAFWRQYGPPRDGWPIRRAVYQLWPAIVHLRLFGLSYLSLAERLIAQIPV
ncbi:fructosamine kinase family protein [Marimonas arenosa]|uniref:Fructosamine kinase family protein n=1 Tax=Marimonas arenosa TaxID=1795305 RepID=A0AAE4B6G5_9RHOB|nr:fructosamine kinase family protein [Marimonas arenosa]MDQ2091324.1 fructosamine kinase family protein [Marimonas arenosa]